MNKRDKDEEVVPFRQSKVDKDFMDTYNKMLDEKFDKMKLLNKVEKSKELRINVGDDITSKDKMG